MRVAGRTGLKRAARVALAALAVTGLAAPASAQLFLVPPTFPSGPIDGSDPLVGLPLPGATPAEYRRGATSTVWESCCTKC